MSKLKSFSAFCARSWYSFKSWLHKRQVKKYNRLTKRQFILQCRIKTLDEKLVSYIKKTQSKKQKLEARLHKVSNKLDKWGNVTPVEAVKDPRTSLVAMLKK